MKKQIKFFLITTSVFCASTSSIFYVSQKNSNISSKKESENKLNSIFEEKIVLTSPISNQITFDNTIMVGSFDLYGVSSISPIRAILVGENSDKISLWIDWSEYQPWNINDPKKPGKNAKICWKIRESNFKYFSGKLQLIYTPPGEKAKILCESENFSVSNKSSFEYSLEILNTASEYDLIESAAIFTFNNQTENPDDFEFFLQNQFGNNQKWDAITTTKDNKITISFKNNNFFKEDETTFLFGRIAVIKKNNSQQKTILISENKNFELRKVCFLSIENTSGEINKELKDFASLKINNKYANNKFAAKLYNSDDTLISNWKAEISNGISGRQINLIPPASDEQEISKDLKMKIFLNNKLVEESKIIKITLSSQEPKNFERSNVSFVLLDNLFWIEKDLDETFDIGIISIGANCDQNNLQYKVWNVDNQSYDKNVVLQINYDSSKQGVCYLKYLKKNELKCENKYKIQIFNNEKIVKETSIFSVRDVENTSTNKQEKTMVYKFSNNNISHENFSSITFKNAFAVYATSAWSNQEKPWSNYQYDLVNNHNKKIEYKNLSFTKIIRSNKCIGWYVDVSLDSTKSPEELKLVINLNGKIVQNSEYVLLSEINKFLNFNQFCIPKTGKTLSFLEFEIPDIDPDFDDVRVEMIDQYGEKNSNFKISINSSGEETLCSIELIKKDVSIDFYGHINIFANDELIGQTNNQLITIHEISGSFSKWEGDLFTFSNRKFDGKISFNVINYDVSKCQFDLIDKYGKSYLSKDWIMSSQIISNNKIEFYISPPVQFMEDSFQELKVVAYAYKKIVAESELFLAEIMHPNLILNKAWEESSQGFSYKGGKENIKSVKINNAFILYKNLDIGKALLDISSDLKINDNDKLNIFLNKTNSKNNILSYDFEYAFTDFKYFLKEIPNPIQNFTSFVNKNYYYKFTQNIPIAPKVFYKNNSKIFEMEAMTINIEGILKLSMSYNTADPIASYFWDLYEIQSIKCEQLL